MHRIIDHLDILGQHHLAYGLHSLSSEKLARFLQEIEKLPLSLLTQQRKALLHPPASAALTPFVPTDASSKSVELATMGCLILAGGQGSRLQTDLPKALLSVSPVHGKTLLQISCEKTAAASRQARHPLRLAVMTSPLNHEAIANYLREHRNFGLESIDLFSQEMAPFLDDRGNWMLEAPGKIAQGPDGNGDCLKQFVASGIWKKWHEAGLRHLNVVPIDNPLADPFDAHFLGTHVQHGCDVSLKTVVREPAGEPVGVVGWKNGKIAVQEYTELPSADFRIAHIGLYCFDFDFILRAAQVELPWHLARKTAIVLLSTSKGACQERVRIWKCERFIFDLLEYARSAHVAVYPREKTYAPLKNSLGEKSFETVRSALQMVEKEVYEQISGLPAPAEPFELDPAFHYPTEALLETWKGKPLPI